MTPDPLVDYRFLNISVQTPSQVIIDYLLRMQSGKDGHEPITICISASEDNRSMGVLEFLQIHAVIQALPSPVYTVALGGMLRGYEVLLFADGQRGHRHILQHTLFCLEPFRFQNIPFTDKPIGMGRVPDISLRQQAEQLLRAELDIVLHGLELDPALFQIARILDSAEAISRGIADVVVPIDQSVGSKK